MLAALAIPIGGWGNFIRFFFQLILKWWSCVVSNKRGRVSALLGPRVLSIAARTRTPKACTHSGQSKRLRSACANQNATFQLRQSGRVAVVTPNWPKANSRTFRRVTLKHARLTQQHVKGCIFCNTSLRPHRAILSLGSITNHFRSILFRSMPLN